MIVQPTPTEPPVRARRARTVGRLVAPVALLGIVVAAGVVGPRVEAVRPAPQVAASQPAGEPDSKLPGSLANVGVPAMFGDLEAMAPAEFQELEDEASPSTAHALVGWLEMDAGAMCGDAEGGPFGTWCDRHGVVSLAPGDEASSAPFPAHVRVQVPAGVRLPSIIEGAGPGDEPGPIPVLVVGRRAVPPAACLGYGPAICQDEFVVDRVAWADGARVGLSPLIDDRLQSDRRPNPFMTSLDAADLPLLAALVWPEDVWRLDADAGIAAMDGTPGGPVWYLRVLDGARGPSLEREVRWTLLTERDLQVVASGQPGSGFTTATIEPG